MHTKEWLNISHDPRCCVVKEKFQFQYKMDQSRHPWAFKRDDPQKRIAALELYGTLFLALLPMAQQPSTACRLHIPLVSDNQGNVYSILNNADPQGFDPTLKVSLTIFPKVSLEPPGARWVFWVPWSGSKGRHSTHTQKGCSLVDWVVNLDTTTLAHRY